MDQGFKIVSGVLNVHEIESLRSALESVPRGRAGARHLLSHESVRRVAKDARLARLAAEMLGADAQPFKATLFDKSPASNWLVTWHQDLALPMKHQRDAPGWGPWTHKGGRLHALATAEALQRVVALRVHLDDSASDNGPLRVLPATHREGRLSDDRIAQLARTTAPVECVVPAGGVVAMRPLVIHASSKSTGNRPRRVLHIEYSTETVFGPGIELASD